MTEWLYWIHARLLDDLRLSNLTHCRNDLRIPVCASGPVLMLNRGVLLRRILHDLRGRGQLDRPQNGMGHRHLAQSEGTSGDAYGTGTKQAAWLYGNSYIAEDEMPCTILE
jgi:hypothetical protein